MDKTYTVTKGERGAGRVLTLETMLAFKDEQIKSLTEEMDRWKSAAFCYQEKAAKMEKTKPDESKWIPVAEMLPNLYETVIVCDVREQYVGAWMYYGNGDWLHDDKLFDTEEITHWMPLPEVPKEV